MEDARLLSVRSFARIYFQDRLADGAEPTKAMCNTVTRMCRDRTVPARKLGKKWFVQI